MLPLRCWCVLGALWFAPVASHAADPPALTALLQSTPADSLGAPLRRLEARTRGVASGEVARVLGQWHYTRGEYRQSAEAWGRAAARYEPSRKPEARYWAGLAWLAAGEAGRARASLEEAAADGSPRRAEARVGLAYVHESEGRLARALELLEGVIAGPASEVTPAALERASRLAGRLGRGDVARRHGERLKRQFPASPEALRRTESP